MIIALFSLGGIRQRSVVGSVICSSKLQESKPGAAFPGFSDNGNRTYASTD